MSATESFKKLIGAIPNIEDFDEEIGEVTDALVSAENADNGIFEEKYNKLLEKYRARFGEMLSESAKGVADLTPDEPAVTDEIDSTPSIADLDFDGSTE